MDLEFDENFTKISQFNTKLPLNPLVVSDHAEIIIETEYGIISSWNISNPSHHHYFGSIPDGSFKYTHMYDTNPNSIFLTRKIEDQIESIVDRLITEKVDIQIIVEGYLDFYQMLEERIKDLGFYLYYDKNPLNFSDLPINKINVTGILVNLDKYNLLKQIIFSEQYEEKADRIRRGEKYSTRSFNVPVLYLQPKESDILLVIGGIHIHGSNSRYPKSGLDLLYNTINIILEDEPNTMIMMGDFNTIPNNVRSSLLYNNEKIPIEVVLTNYPTLINPKTEVSFYDMAIIYGLSDYNMLSIEYTSEYTQALYESILRSRKHYIM